MHMGVNRYYQNSATNETVFPMHMGVNRVTMLIAPFSGDVFPMHMGVSQLAHKKDPDKPGLLLLQ